MQNLVLFRQLTLTCPDPGQVVVEGQDVPRTLRGRQYSDSVNYNCPMNYLPGREKITTVTGRV